MTRTWTSPNYPLVYRKVKEVRQKLSPTFKPSMKELVNLLHSYGVTVNTYDQYAKSNGVDLSQVPYLLGSEEGVTLYDGEHSILYYNKHQHNRSRKNWTITHEAGHILLGHLQNIQKENVYISPNVLNVMEQEANFFAKEFLAPSPLVLAIVSSYTLQPTIYDYYLVYRYFFQLSKQTSKYCAEFMHKYLNLMISLFDNDYLITYKDALVNMCHTISDENFMTLHDYMTREYNHEFPSHYIKPLTHISKILIPHLTDLVNRVDNQKDVI